MTPQEFLAQIRGRKTSKGKVLRLAGGGENDPSSPDYRDPNKLQGDHGAFQFTNDNVSGINADNVFSGKWTDDPNANKFMPFGEYSSKVMDPIGLFAHGTGGNPFVAQAAVSDFVPWGISGTEFGANNNLSMMQNQEVYQQQGELANQLREQAAGRGPSLAQSQLQMATDRNNSQAAGMMGSQRGVSGALAMRNAANQAGQNNMGAAGQSAMIRNQEMMAARGQLADLYQQQRAGSLGALNAGIQGNQLNLGQQQLMQQTSAQNAQNMMDAQRINAEVAMNNAKGSQGMLGGIFNGAGAAMSAANGAEVPQRFAGGGGVSFATAPGGNRGGPALGTSGGTNPLLQAIMMGILSKFLNMAFKPKAPEKADKPGPSMGMPIPTGMAPTMPDGSKLDTSLSQLPDLREPGSDPLLERDFDDAVDNMPLSESAEIDPQMDTSLGSLSEMRNPEDGLIGTGLAGGGDPLPLNLQGVQSTPAPKPPPSDDGGMGGIMSIVSMFLSDGGEPTPSGVRDDPNYYIGRQSYSLPQLLQAIRRKSGSGQAAAPSSPIRKFSEDGVTVVTNRPKRLADGGSVESMIDKYTGGLDSLTTKTPEPIDPDELKSTRDPRYGAKEMVTKYLGQISFARGGEAPRPFAEGGEQTSATVSPEDFYDGESYDLRLEPSEQTDKLDVAQILKDALHESLAVGVERGIADGLGPVLAVPKVAAETFGPGVDKVARWTLDEMGKQLNPLAELKARTVAQGLLGGVRGTQPGDQLDQFGQTERGRQALADLEAKYGSAAPAILFAISQIPNIAGALHGAGAGKPAAAASERPVLPKFGDPYPAHLESLNKRALEQIRPPEVRAGSLMDDPAVQQRLAKMEEYASSLRAQKEAAEAAKQQKLADALARAKQQQAELDDFFKKHGADSTSPKPPNPDKTGPATPKSKAKASAVEKLKDETGSYEKDPDQEPLDFAMMELPKAASDDLPVVTPVVDQDGKVYNGIKDAAQAHGLSPKQVEYMLQGKRGKAGLSFKFVDETSGEKFNLPARKRGMMNADAPQGEEVSVDLFDEEGSYKPGDEGQKLAVLADALQEKGHSSAHRFVDVPPERQLVAHRPDTLSLQLLRKLRDERPNGFTRKEANEFYVSLGGKRAAAELKLGNLLNKFATPTNKGKVGGKWIVTEPFESPEAGALWPKTAAEYSEKAAERSANQAWKDKPKAKLAQGGEPVTEDEYFEMWRAHKIAKNAFEANPSDVRAYKMALNSKADLDEARRLYHSMQRPQKLAAGGLPRDFGPGGQVPGQAVMPGDHPQNDQVPALLSPKEKVLPRSVTMSADPPERAAGFVQGMDVAKRQMKPDMMAMMKRQAALQQEIARLQAIIRGR